MGRRLGWEPPPALQISKTFCTDSSDMTIYTFLYINTFRFILFGAEVFVSPTDNSFLVTFLLFYSGNKLLSATCLQEVGCDYFQKMRLKLFSMFADCCLTIANTVWCY